MQSPGIAFSGGKDSSIVLHLVRQQVPDTLAFFGDEEWRLPETEALIAATPNVTRTALRDAHAEWFTAWENTRPDPEQALWIEPGKYDEFNYERELLHLDGKFLGLRADESRARGLHLKRHGALHFCQAHELWECSPIASWTVEDVWGYLLARAVPYNRAYDKLCELGVPLEWQRIGPLAQARVLSFGQLAILKRGWPELFNRFAAKYPEARNCV